MQADDHGRDDDAQDDRPDVEHGRELGAEAVDAVRPPMPLHADAFNGDGFHDEGRGNPHPEHVRDHHPHGHDAVLPARVPALHHDQLYYQENKPQAVHGDVLPPGHYGMVILVPSKGNPVDGRDDDLEHPRRKVQRVHDEAAEGAPVRAVPRMPEAQERHQGKVHEQRQVAQVRELEKVLDGVDGGGELEGAVEGPRDGQQHIRKEQQAKAGQDVGVDVPAAAHPILGDVPVQLEEAFKEI